VLPLIELAAPSMINQGFVVLGGFTLAVVLLVRFVGVGQAAGEVSWWWRGG
jgi:hypothetical protein